MRKRIKKVVWTSLPSPVRHGLLHLDRDLREWAQDPREKARKVLMTSLPKPLRHRLLGVLEVCEKERLYEWAQDPQKRMYIKRYLKLVDAGRLSWRLKLRKKQRAKACQTVHRVAFVASLGDMRVMRLAAAAQSAGLKLLLLVQHDTAHRDGMVMPELLEKVVWYNSVPHDLPLILDEIKAFDADLVHCFIQCDRNHLGAWLIANCDVPFVGDAYDMVNVQFNPDYPDYGHWYPQNSLWEKRWYENSDGICFRSPYKRAMTTLGIKLPEKVPFIHIPEPLLRTDGEKAQKKRQILVSCHDRLLYDIIPDLERIWKNMGLEIIILDSGNCTPDHIKKAYTVFPKLLYKEYTKLLSESCCLFLSPFPEDVIRRNDRFEFVHLVFQNKSVDALQYKCSLLFPSWYKYIGTLYKRTGKFFGYDISSLFDGNLWSRAVGAGMENTDLPDAYFEARAGEKLRTFYDRVAMPACFQSQRLGRKNS